MLREQFPEVIQDFGREINLQIELTLKYAGYIQRQEKEVAKLETIEKILIPNDFDFSKVNGLSREAREKLQQIRPANLGQAARLSGISPADISVLMVALKR